MHHRYYIDADPAFAVGSLRITVTSPAKDVSSNGDVPADTADLDGDENTSEQTPLDLDRMLRFVNTTVDMGAYEYRTGYVLTVVNSGGGTVQSPSPPTPRHIDCGGDCSEVYPLLPVASVILTAVADSESVFHSWYGCDSKTSTPTITCTVAMNSDRLVGALFGQDVVCFCFQLLVGQLNGLQNQQKDTL